MAQVINTNIASLNTQRHLNASKADLEVAMERLSSGLRINSARDDAAGLAISQRFTAQINGMDQAARNANDGISFAQTAEGAMEEMSNLLQRVRELAVQSANDTNSPSDRRALDAEVQQAVQELDRIAQSTQFNQQNVLDGTLRELVFQVGANRGQAIATSGMDVRAENLGADVIDGLGIMRAGDDDMADEIPDQIYINGREIDLQGIRDVNELARTINEKQSVTGVTAEQADRAVSQPVSFEGLFDVEEGEGASDAQARITLNGTGIELRGNEIESMDDIAARINDHAADTGVRLERDQQAGGETLEWSFVANENFTIEYEGDGALQLGGRDVGTGLSDGGEGLHVTRGLSLGTEVGRELAVSEDAAGTVEADGVLTGLGLSIAGDDRIMRTRDYTVGGENRVSVETRRNAADAIVTVDHALQQIANTRADLGAVQNRFESTVSNLEISSENLSASRSRVLDADFAEETAELTRAEILQQAGSSVLSQANQVPQNVLQLLQG